MGRTTISRAQRHRIAETRTMQLRAEEEKELVRKEMFYVLGNLHARHQTIAQTLKGDFTRPMKVALVSKMQENGTLYCRARKVFDELLDGVPDIHPDTTLFNISQIIQDLIDDYESQETCSGTDSDSSDDDDTE